MGASSRRRDSSIARRRVTNDASRGVASHSHGDGDGDGLIRRARGFPTTMIDHERTNEETRGGRACRSLLELGAGLDGAPADQTPVLFDATTEGDLFADLGAHGRGELQLGEIRLDGDDAGAGAH